MRRVAAALLVVSIAVAGVAVCSRGVQACVALMANNPDCCGGGENLAAGDCCCATKGEQASALPTLGELVRAAGFNPLLATAPSLPAPLFAPVARAATAAPLARALAPPETLISLHTSLLL